MGSFPETYNDLGRVVQSRVKISGRKNVLRKLLRIPYRRLKAGFSVCLSLHERVERESLSLTVRLNEMHKV